MLAPTDTDASGQVGNQVAALLRDKVDKTKSTYPRYKTYADFFCKIGKRKLLSQDLFEVEGTGEESYWRYDWHFKCVTYLFTEFNWPVASHYDRLVMDSWTHIDIAQLSDSAALRRGDFERACEPYSLGRSTAGAKRRKHPEDKWEGTGDLCSYCDNYGHVASKCRKKARDEKAAGADKI